MTEWEIVCDDVIRWAMEYEGPKFHAILTDPPYGLEFMGKKWDAPWKTGMSEYGFKDGKFRNVGPVHGSKRNPVCRICHKHQRGSKGCTCQKPDFDETPQSNWRKYQAIATEWFAALAEHLLPGGFVMAFASSRGWHRLACALEDAGLIIQPSIFIWLNAQSFPKATRIDKKLDEQAGKLEERKIVGKYQLPNGKEWNLKQADDSELEAAAGAFTASGRRTLDVEEPATDLARAWEGHRYGGQILKNCAEPIIVAQKPWDGKRLDCIVDTGAGALNIEAARIAGPSWKWGTQTDIKGGGYGSKRPSDGDVLARNVESHPSGRWPSNFCLIHSEGCERVGVKRVKNADCKGKPSQIESQGQVYGGGQHNTTYADPDGMETVDAWNCVESCPARRLGEQSGESGTGKARTSKRRVGFRSGKYLGQIGHGDLSEVEVVDNYADKGTAARFFFQADWEYECVEGCPIAKLDEQAGERPGGRPITNPRAESVDAVYRKYPSGRSSAGSGRQDSGGPSRFYHNADWSHEITEQIVNADPVRYCPKAARKERANGLDDFYWRKDKKAPMGFVRIDKDEWEALGEEEERIYEETSKRVSLRAQGNIHPTCKPISLNKWLATLLLPPSEYAPRRILVPFFGSGSEGIGALLAGWEEIIGIDFQQDYCEIGEARMTFWQNQKRLETAQLSFLSEQK